jgi:MoaA/NifB/PqqE/SkfB family radical SAM enzyme
VLDYLLPIEWRDCGDGDYLGRPIGDLPPGFELLFKASGNAIAQSSMSGGAIRLHLPWVYSREGAIVFDAAVRYDRAAGAFRIARDDAEAVKDRIASAREGPLTAVGEQSTGCFGRISASPISPAFAAALGPAFDARRANLDDRIWVVGPAPVEGTPGPPDALAFHADALPQNVSLTVEATTACNFRCGFCYGRHMEQGVLHSSQFAALLDNVPGVTTVEFTGEGEPLMNRDTPEMIRLCKARGHWVHLTSNGSRMTPERAEMILDLGIDSFAVSLESLDPEGYARSRPGGRLEELEHAIAMLRRAMSVRGRGPELRLWVSLTRDRLSAIEQFFDYADHHGFDRVEFQTLNSLPAYARYYPPALDGQISTRADVVAVLRSPDLSNRARRALTELRQAFEGSTCDRFLHGLAPNWQGQLSTCGLLKIPDFASVGDLTAVPLDQIWAGEEFRRFRFALLHGVILESCVGCVCVAAATGSNVRKHEDLVE